MSCARRRRALDLPVSQSHRTIPPAPSAAPAFHPAKTSAPPRTYPGCRRHLLDDCRHIPRHAYVHGPVAPYLRRRRVHLHDAGGIVEDSPVSDAVVQLLAKDKHGVGATHQLRGPVQRRVEEPQAVGMVVRHQPPRLVRRHQRYPRRLDEPLQPRPVAPVARRRCCDNQRTFGGMENLHRLRNLRLAYPNLPLKSMRRRGDSTESPPPQPAAPARPTGLSDAPARGDPRMPSAPPLLSCPVSDGRRKSATNPS